MLQSVTFVIDNSTLLFVLIHQEIMIYIYIIFLYSSHSGDISKITLPLWRWHAFI